LFLNRWYAGEVGCRIETDRADLFEYRPAAPFDVICSHGFLSQFAPDRRREVVATWTRLLAPEGVVLAVNRVRPNASNQEIRFSEQQALDFCRIVEQRIRESRSLSESESAQVLERTRIYVRRLHGYAITRAQIGQLFEGGRVPGGRPFQRRFRRRSKQQRERAGDPGTGGTCVRYRHESARRWLGCDTRLWAAQSRTERRRPVVDVFSGSVKWGRGFRFLTDELGLGSWMVAQKMQSIPRPWNLPRSEEIAGIISRTPRSILPHPAPASIRCPDCIPSSPPPSGKSFRQHFAEKLCRPD